MLKDLVFVGFKSKVAALDRETGETIWTWKSPQGGGYVTILLDGDRLIVSVQGYTYCLDPATGYQRWFNELKGMGFGVASLASVRGGSVTPLAQAAEQETQSQQAAAHSTMM